MGKDIKKYLPPKLQNDTLFKEFVDQFESFTGPIEDQIVDVIGKYSGDESLSPEMAIEILREKGLDSLADLLAVAPEFDVYSVLFFASAISFFKGDDSGYFLVLDLLNFEYTAQIWYEQEPRGNPHTFALDVTLDASIINNPFETFQRIKRFTGDYLMPIIDPLSYTYFISYGQPAIALKGAAHPTYNGTLQTSADDALLFGNTNFILADENGQSWNVFINNLGQVFSEQTNKQPIEEFLTQSNGVVFKFVVDTNGQLGFEEVASLPEPMLQENELPLYLESGEDLVANKIPITITGEAIIDFTLVDNAKRDWKFEIDNGDLTTALV